MSLELTGNLLIDTREKNHDVMAEVGRKWNEVSGGTAITFGLGLRGGDYALECVDTETGETSAHPEFRAEAKWMSGSGPTDLFRSTSAYYRRLKAELESFADRHKHTLFVCQGKASDLLRHNTPGKITWDKTVTRIFWLNAKFRVPFIFADRATSWLTSWFWAGSQFEGEKQLYDINKPRPFRVFMDPMKLESALHKSVEPGTQFFCGFQAPKQNRQDLRYCRRMVSEDLGFWFFDYPSFKKDKEAEAKALEALTKLADQWAKIEAHESALRAVGGYPETPELYDGYLNTLDQYTPNKGKPRLRRNPVVIFSDQGDRPLICMFEVPKNRGVEIQVMLPIGPNGKDIDLGSVEKPSDVYYCHQLFKIKSTEKTEFDLIPEILRRCREHWNKDDPQEEATLAIDLDDKPEPAKPYLIATGMNELKPILFKEKEPCSSESRTKSSEPVKSSKAPREEPEESADAAEEAVKSSPSTGCSADNLPPVETAEEAVKAEIQGDKKPILYTANKEAEEESMSKSGPRKLDYSKLAEEVSLQSKAVFAIVMGVAKTGKTTVVSTIFDVIDREKVYWISAGELDGWASAAKRYGKFDLMDMDAKLNHAEELWGLLEWIEKSSFEAVVFDSFDGASRWIESIICSVSPKRRDRETGLNSIDRDGHGLKLSFSAELMRRLDRVRASGKHVLMTCGAKVGDWGQKKNIIMPDISGQAALLVPRFVSDIGLIVRDSAGRALIFDDPSGESLVGSRSGFPTMESIDFGKHIDQLVKTGGFDMQEAKTPAPEKNIEKQAKAENVELPATAPSFDSKHKDKILAAFKEVNIPLDPYMDDIAFIYGEESWDQWRPIESVAANAIAFVQVFGWIFKQANEEFALDLVDRELIPIDMYPQMPAMLVKYVEKHCPDRNDEEAFEQCIMDGLESLHVSEEQF